MDVWHYVQGVLLAQSFEEIEGAFSDDDYEVKALEHDTMELFASREALCDQAFVLWIKELIILWVSEYVYKRAIKVYHQVSALKLTDELLFVL